MTATVDAVPGCGGRLSGGLLVDLPPELVTAICVYVACPTVLGCRLVCRRLRDVIDGSLELQYLIELMRDGMIDGPRTCPPPPRPSPSSSSDADADDNDDAAEGPGETMGTTTTAKTTSDRLARLRQLRSAWRTLGWTYCVPVPMPGPCCAYELVGGVFCKTQPASRRRGGGADAPGDGHGGGEQAGWGGGLEWEWASEQATHVHGARTMSLTWLPQTQDLPPRPRGVVRDDLGIPTRDFAMDPSQDLMVLLKGGEDVGLLMVTVFLGALELHIRTMSTNQPHPEAGAPVLCTPVLYPVTSVFVQIVDDVVGLMYCMDPARPRITIWNWKTGHLVVDRASGALPSGTWDFSFINSRALFVTSTAGSGALELFAFTCDHPADVDASTDSLVHVGTLCLPSIYPSVHVLSVSTHTGPFLAACPPGAAFVSSNGDRVHVLAVQYAHLPTLDGPRTRPRVGVVVHQRAFEKCLERKRAQKGATSVPVKIPWSEWGRLDARMLLHMGMFQWLRYVHGQRVVMLFPTSKAGNSTLQVLDFNARRAFIDDAVAAPHASTGAGSDADADADESLGKTVLERVDRPTRIVMPHIFVDAVESGLPYREVRRDVRGDYSGVMIDDERLVGLKYPAFLTGDMKQLDVFTM